MVKAAMVMAVMVGSPLLPSPSCRLWGYRGTVFGGVIFLKWIVFKGGWVGIVFPRGIVFKGGWGG